MQASVLNREFAWNGVKIPDPGSHLSPEEVRAMLATMYPDIATATITGSEAVGEKLFNEVSMAGWDFEIHALRTRRHYGGCGACRKAATNAALSISSARDLQTASRND